MVFVEQTEPLSLDKNIVITSGFNGSSVNTTILHHVFSLDGNVTVGDDNDVLIMDYSKFAFEGSICKLYYDVVAQQVKYTFSLGEYFIDIIFDFVVNPIKVKITIIGSLAQPLTVKLPISTSNSPYTNGINIFSKNIGFDWSDIVSGQDGCIGVSWNNTKNELILNLDTTFEIDPSTIASFSIYSTLGGIGSHMVVYASGRYWVFLTSSEYYTSTDGVNWSSATTLHSGYKLHAVWYNGTRLDAVYTASANLYYESFTLNSNGTVTSLSSGLKTIFTSYEEYDSTNPDYYIRYVYYADNTESFGTTQICIDSNNRPWITFVYYTVMELYDWNTYEPIGSYNTPENKITTSSVTDGSGWTTQSPFPLSFGSYNTGYSLLTPLTEGKVAVAYRYMYGGNNQIKMLIYDVTNRLIQEAQKLNETSSNHASIVSVGDDVYITDYISSANYCVGYIKYTCSSNTFGSWTAISSNTGSLNTAVPPSITKDTSGNLYLFWASAPTTDHIYYRKMNSDGTWDSIVDWKDNSAYSTIMNIQQMGYGTLTATCPTNSGIDNPAVAWLRYVGTNTVTCYFDELVLFPPQFGGFKMRTSSGTVELCMVARGDGNASITDKLRTQKGSTIYDLYLVETSDINASSVHIKTSQGIKAIRKKT